MGKIIPPDVNDKIIAMWYAGHQRDQIAQELGVSAGHIDAVIKRERMLIGERNVEALRRLAVALSKTQHGLGEIQNTIRLLNACAVQNMDVDGVVETLPHLDALCRKAGVKLELLPLDLESKIRSNKELEDKTETLKKELFDLEERRIKKISKAGQTEESLAKSAQINDFLVKYDLQADAPEKLRNTITNAEEAGYDGKVLVEKLSVISSLEAEKTKIKEATMQSERRLAESTEQLQHQRLEIQSNSRLLNEADDLRNMGCTDPMLRAMAEIIKRVAVTSSLTLEQATESFVNDMLANYEILGDFKAQVLAKQEENSRLDADSQVLKIKHAKYQRAVDALQTIQDKGIDTSDILALLHLLETQGFNSAKLSNDVGLIGGAEKMRQGIEGEIKGLREEKLTLEPAVTDLRNRKVALEKHLSWLKDSISDAENIAIKRISAIGEAATQVTERYINSQGMLIFEPLVRFLKGEQVSVAEVRDKAILVLNLLLTLLPSRSDSSHILSAAIKAVKEDLEIEFAD